MKYFPIIASFLLGLLFLMASITFFFTWCRMSNSSQENPKALFMGAFGPTGYFAFVKSCELVGAILVLIPRTRNFGLLVLGPIIVNILAYGIFIDKSAMNPFTFAVAVLAAYLLFAGRKAFLGLLKS